MLLQSIELQNFRHFINEKIDFSTDPERNVTLIIGENGTGKTTFAQAFSGVSMEKLILLTRLCSTESLLSR